MPKASKGGAWERELSRKLSLWWSDGDFDDWFWRTGGSGGRATVRGKAGRSTANGYGDICAQCKAAQDLMDLLCIEAKRGYAGVTIQDLLDKSDGGKALEFIEQAQKSASLAGTPYWAVIHKRDRREPLIWTNAWFPGFSLQWHASIGIFPERILVVQLSAMLTREAREWFQGHKNADK